MAVPGAFGDDNRETSVTWVCEGGMHLLAPHREMLRNVDDNLLAFAFVGASDRSSLAPRRRRDAIRIQYWATHCWGIFTLNPVMQTNLL